MIPNAVVFTILVVAFQVSVAVFIFTRGDLTTVALLAGAGFAFLAALAFSPGGTAGNLLLGGVQLALALARVT